jgi:enoyl-CoA hydratase/carnithine racemase
VTTPDFDNIVFEIEDGVATVTLNRPDKLNAMNESMRRELMAALDHTDANDDVRAVIWTGAGRGYCAGADLSGGSATFDYSANVGDGSAKPKVQRDGGGQLTLRIYESVKPIIGAINGAAVGVGVTMTLPMDVRLASTEAKFGFVFARRGIVPEACSSWFLPRVVGISRALEWTYSGRVFSAAEALDAGLVRSLHAPDELLPAARELARTFTEETSPLSVSTTRQMLWRMLGADHPMEAHKVDSRMVQELGAGPDAAEGVASFLEKRPAHFESKPSSQLPPSMPWWDERPFE